MATQGLLPDPGVARDLMRAAEADALSALATRVHGLDHSLCVVLSESEASLLVDVDAAVSAAGPASTTEARELLRAPLDALGSGVRETIARFGADEADAVKRALAGLAADLQAVQAQEVRKAREAIAHAKKQTEARLDAIRRSMNTQLLKMREDVQRDCDAKIAEAQRLQREAEAAAAAKLMDHPTIDAQAMLQERAELRVKLELLTEKLHDDKAEAAANIARHSEARVDAERRAAQTRRQLDDANEKLSKGELAAGVAADRAKRQADELREVRKELAAAHAQVDAYRRQMMALKHEATAASKRGDLSKADPATSAERPREAPAAPKAGAAPTVTNGGVADSEVDARARTAVACQVERDDGRRSCVSVVNVPGGPMQRTPSVEAMHAARHAALQTSAPPRSQPAAPDAGASADGHSSGPDRAAALEAAMAAAAPSGGYGGSCVLPRVLPEAVLMASTPAHELPQSSPSPSRDPAADADQSWTGASDAGEASACASVFTAVGPRNESGEVDEERRLWVSHPTTQQPGSDKAAAPPLTSAQVSALYTGAGQSQYGKRSAHSARVRHAAPHSSMEAAGAEAGDESGAPRIASSAPGSSRANRAAAAAAAEEAAIAASISSTLDRLSVDGVGMCGEACFGWAADTSPPSPIHEEPQPPPRVALGPADADGARTPRPSSVAPGHVPHTPPSSRPSVVRPRGTTRAAAISRTPCATLPFSLLPTNERPGAKAALPRAPAEASEAGAIGGGRGAGGTSARPSCTFAGPPPSLVKRMQARQRALESLVDTRTEESELALQAADRAVLPRSAIAAATAAATAADVRRSVADPTATAADIWAACEPLTAKPQVRMATSGGVQRRERTYVGLNFCR